MRRTDGNLTFTIRAVRDADGGEEHPQEILQICHRADGGTRVHRDGFLLDGDDRGEPIDEIDIGFLELRDEAFGVSGH